MTQPARRGQGAARGQEQAPAQHPPAAQLRIILPRSPGASLRWDAWRWQRPNSCLEVRGRFAGLWRPRCWCCWGISTGLRKEVLTSARVAKAKQHLAAAVRAGGGVCVAPTPPPPPTQQLSIPWAPDTSRVRPSPPVHSCTSWAPASPDPAPDRSRSVGAELWFCVPVDPQAEDAERRNPSCRQRAGAS